MSESDYSLQYINPINRNFLESYLDKNHPDFYLKYILPMIKLHKDKFIKSKDEWQKLSGYNLDKEIVKQQPKKVLHDIINFINGEDIDKIYLLDIWSFLDDIEKEEILSHEQWIK